MSKKVITCAHCGTAMPTPAGRASRKRFCNTACRKAAWRERHRDDNITGADVVPHVVPGILAVPTAFPDDVPNHGGQDQGSISIAGMTGDYVALP